MTPEEQIGAQAWQRDKIRKLAPPVTAILLVALITATILPSSLNLPQTNPSTVLEYAPIPPEDESAPPFQGGGLSSLGLAGSTSLTSGVPAPEPPPLTKRELPPIEQQKRCTGGRQTEDPNSPPCQSFFQGDNFGATWQGVTGNEVTVLYIAAAGTIIDQGQGQAQPTPSNGTYCDVENLDCNGDGQPDSNPHMWMQILNSFSRYFNARYQTYDRYVRFYIYWTNANSPASRRGDAADNWERLKPFAVLLNLWHGGFIKEYIAAMAHRQVSVFGAFPGEPRSYFQEYSPRVWSYWPDIENHADMFVGYVCNKVVGTKVNRGQYAGQDRVYGLLSTRDPEYTNLHDLRELVRAGVQRCGVTFTEEKTFRSAKWWFNNANAGQDRAEAETNMATFQAAGVNTIIWPGGAEVHHSEAAGKQGYRPEWAVAGDGDLDGRGFASRQDQDAWQSAWVQSYQPRVDNREKDPGYQAYKEADPDGTNYNWAINMYRDLFMLFTAIQVAGPRLSPPSVDAGLHAIQRQRSTSPYIVSFWFHPGDYTGVKDAAEYWWDSAASDPNGNVGCYRMVKGGQRYSYDEWGLARGAGIDVPGYNVDEPCTGYAGTGVAFRVA